MAELKYLDARRSLTIIVYGEAKAGKSWFADTAPKPLLVLDAEGGSTHTPSGPKIVWDPRSEEPPEPNGWETCVVYVRDYDTIDRAYQWLNMGPHPFKSVVIDSLTEVQKKFIDKLAGANQLKIQDWGDVLRHMEKLVRDFRDLTMHPTNPLETVVYITLTGGSTDDKLRPFVHGSLNKTLPYYTDVVGAFVTAPDTENPMVVRRYLVCQPVSHYLAGDRTDKLPPYLENPNIEEMLDIIYGKKMIPAAPAETAPV